ncbi:serine hydrolase [bacterium]|nr:serine hydrolase [bacterium]
MPRLAGKYQGYEYSSPYAKVYDIYYARQYHETRPKVKKKKNLLQLIISSIILILISITTIPVYYKNITKTFLNPTPYKNVNIDLKEFVHPSYLSNSIFLGTHLFEYASEGKEAQMIKPEENTNMPVLGNSLKLLMDEYKTVIPAIYVWDYDTGNYIDINASQTYPTASIIKIPVLIDLFKSIENNQVALDDVMSLTEYYRTEGSGSLQFKAENSKYTIDELANRMITESDNSATNMLMSKIGGMPDVNAQARSWGLKNTEVHTWLPDLKGTNFSTAREMGTMLYNIDSNEKFLTQTSRNKIFEYMGHVHNDRLIQAGLGAGAKFYHKTGDIGSMLGDAGIVITPNGKKYIVVIFARRPHNSIAGKDFIVKASKIIYSYMVK